MFENKSIKYRRTLTRAFADFHNMLEEHLKGTIVDIEFHDFDDLLYVRTEWEDYCRGCHMGTESEEYRIPLDALDYLSGWVEKDKQRKKEAQKKTKEASEQASKEYNAKMEREEYERLKKKYEGE